MTKQKHDHHETFSSYLRDLNKQLEEAGIHAGPVHEIVTALDRLDSIEEEKNATERRRAASR